MRLKRRFLADTSNGSKNYRRNLVLVAVAFGIIGSIIIGLSHAAPNDFTNVNNDPIDPAYLTDIPFGSHSDYIQPWNAYLDTVPASTLVNAVGINFNISGNSIEPTARILAAHGFKRARIEIGWGSMDYDDPTQLNPSKLPQIQQYITTFKKYGIRPLILLNANSGGPVPYKQFNFQVTQAAKIGDTTIKIDPSVASQLIDDYSGSNFGEPKAPQAKYRFLHVTSDGTVTLSQPLKINVPVGTYNNGATQKFLPFFPPNKDDGSPSPQYAATMNGWLEYVGAVTKTVKQDYGSDDFDVEIWNEVSFGSAFLSAKAYYSPMPSGYATAAGGGEQGILNNTVSYIRNPANGVSDIQIGNGFTNEAPWGSGVNQPIGLTAIDKHPYSGKLFRPAQGQTGMPIDATGQKDPTATLQCVQAADHTKPATWTDSNGNGKLDVKDNCDNGTGVIGMFSPKEPAYNRFLPESFLTGITTETLARDLAPFDNSVQGTLHGRDTKPCANCTPPVMWITEVNLAPQSGAFPDPETDPTSAASFQLSPEEDRHIATKDYLRYLVAYINKGVKAIDFYAANAGDLSVIDPSFFTQLTAGDIKHNPSFYPGDDSGGASLDAISNLVNLMQQGSAPITQPRQLTLTKIADNHNHAQFDSTDNTPGHPPLYDRNALAVLPFQVSDTRFAIPSYVMTRNVDKVYNPGASTTTGARFDLPPEAFQLTMGGFDPTKTLTASAVNPLTNDSTPVSIISQGGGNVVIQADLTDSPRVIIIDESGTSSTPPTADTTPPDTLITVVPGGSRVKTSASFSFTSNENGSTFQCKLDSGDFTACTSPVTYDNVPPGTHTFSVRAIDAAGNIDPTPATDTFTFTVPTSTDTTPPSVPTGLQATAPTSLVVALSWNASTDTGGSGLDGYNIYRNGAKINNNLVTATTYNDVTVNANTGYSYKVEAVDTNGNRSAQTAAVNVTTPASATGLRGDVTGPVNKPDGKIDIYDLSYVIRNYDTNNLNADVSGPDGKPDGKVDIYDMSYIIRNYQH